MVVKIEVIEEGNNGRDRDRTDDLYRVNINRAIFMLAPLVY
jgi:hypothetical protein